MPKLAIRVVSGWDWLGDLLEDWPGPRRPAGAGRRTGACRVYAGHGQGDGQLRCGINGQLPGFSVQNERKEWAGLEIDYCRSVTAAVLGDGSEVQFVPLTATRRFDVLRDGSIDVLMRNTTTSLERTAGTNVRDVTVIYVDAQTVVVAKTLNIKELAELDGKAVCTCATRPISRGGRNGSPSASARSCR